MGYPIGINVFFFFSSRRRHTRLQGDWSSDVCSSDLWLTWLSRIAAVSAVANLFIIYLSEFFPGVRAPFARAGVLMILIGFLAVVNYRGVTGGNRLSNFFTVTKAALLAFFVVTGLTALALHPAIRVTPAARQTTAADWFEAVLLMIYSYVGFEAALIATGETRDARKDIPFAVFTAIGATTLLFIALQYLVIHTIPNVATSSAPAVDSARHFLSPLGVQVVAAGTPGSDRESHVWTPVTLLSPMPASSLKKKK